MVSLAFEILILIELLVSILRKNIGTLVARTYSTNHKIKMKKLFAFAVIGGMLFTTSCTRKQCPAYGSTQPVEQPPTHRA